MKIGIIGGTGLYETPGQRIKIDTKFGDVEVTNDIFKKHELFFISRHGQKSIPPHKINYHANIKALKKCGVDIIIALNTVGSMNEKIAPGTFFVPSDYIDLTGRNATYFSSELVHIDMSEPFCPVTRAILFNEAKKTGNVHEGIYFVTDGPRFETAAEIAMFKKFADVVGMTLSPEVGLARELGMCYASLCTVSNYATGIKTAIDISDIKSIYTDLQEKVLAIIYSTIQNVLEERDCVCKTAATRGTL